MKHIEALKLYNDKRFRWPTSGSLDGTAQWDVEIAEARESELITWPALEGADVGNSGVIRFQPGPGNFGTQVTGGAEYNLPDGVLTSKIAKFLPKELQQQIIIQSASL